MVLAQRIDAEGGRCRHRGRELRPDVEPLAERRHRRGDDALAEVLVVDAADVVGAEAAFSERGVDVLAALLHVEDLLTSAGLMVVRVRELQAALLVVREILGIGELVQVAADDRRRLVALGDGDAFESSPAVGHPHVVAHEVHEVRALQQHVGQPGVVAAVGRDVAVGALLGLFRAHGVRHEGAERLPAEAFRRHRLLHVVVPRAGLVLRADEDDARRAHRRDPVPGDRSVLPEEERVVAQHLEVVGGPVPRRQPLVMEHRHLAVRHHREVTAEAGRRPRCVARVAGHRAVGVRERFGGGRRSPRPVLLNRLRVA